MALDLQLSLLARKVGVWLAEQCSDGRRSFLDPGKLKVAFKETLEDELEEAIA